MPQTAQYPDMERQLASLISRVEELERRRPRIRDNDLDDTIIVRSTMTTAQTGSPSGTATISFSPVGFSEKPLPIFTPENDGNVTAFRGWVRSWTITNGLYVSASVSVAISITVQPATIHIAFIGPGVTNAS